MTTRRTAATTCALLALAATVACGGRSPDSKPSKLPPLPSTDAATSTPASPDTSAREAEVRTTYVSYLMAYERAQHTSAQGRRTYLSRWLADPLLSAYVNDLAYDQKHYYKTVGPERPHISDITVTGTSATVTDCLDRTGVYVVDSRTGDVIAGLRGKPHFLAVTKLRHTGAGWRVYSSNHPAKTCSYG